MSVAKFHITGTFDGAGGVKEGTVEIDRATGMFRVRPKHSRTAYELPLKDVATLVCRQHMYAVVREEKKARQG
jgi:hypothetical protein